MDSKQANVPQREYIHCLLFFTLEATNFNLKKETGSMDLKALNFKFLLLIPKVHRPMKSTWTSYTSRGFLRAGDSNQDIHT